MNVILAKTDTAGPALSDAFAAARARLPGKGKVAEIRRQAFDAYERSGLPHRRIEDWKYTDLRVLMREVLPLAAAPDAAALKRAEAALKAHRDQGHAAAGAGRWRLCAAALRTSATSTKGLTIRSLREALDAGDSRAAGAAVLARQCKSHGGAEQRLCDRWRRDRRRRRHRAVAAAACRSHRGQRGTVGDVHALAAASRQECRGHAGRELSRGRRGQGLSGP